MKGGEKKKRKKKKRKKKRRIKNGAQVEWKQVAEGRGGTRWQHFYHMCVLCTAQYMPMYPHSNMSKSNDNFLKLSYGEARISDTRESCTWFFCRIYSRRVKIILNECRVSLLQTLACNNTIDDNVLSQTSLLINFEGCWKSLKRNFGKN